MFSEFSHGDFRHITSMGRSVFALMLREMVTTYGRSPGGYLWAILEPVAAIAVLSIVFSMAFHSPTLGSNFPLFYATAYLPYMLFLDICMKVATSVRFSMSLLTYPVITITDVLVSRFLLNMLTHILVAVCVISGILMIFDVSVQLDMIAVFKAYAMAAMLGLGFGTLNCYLFMAYPILERLWQIATRPLVIISGLFFLLESVPMPYRDWLWYNPLFHVTGEMRNGVYGMYSAPYVSPVFVTLLSASLFAIGFLLLSRSYRDLIEK